jgi:hypothetical protein
MRKIYFIIACITLATACAQEDKVGTPTEMGYDYILPQGNASQTANDKIKAIYDAYGSFILYEFTQKDFEWSPASGNSSSAVPVADKADPANVEAMVNLLERAWFRFFPDEFLKEKGLPYRVFLTDSIRDLSRAEGSYNPVQRRARYYAYRVAGMSLAFAEVNQSLQSMDPAAAAAKKNSIQAIVWAYYLSKGIIDVSDIPDEFVELSSYTTALGYSATDAQVYARGFLHKLEMSNTMNVFMLTDPVVFNVAKSNWATSVTAMTKLNDVTGYIEHITQKTTAELQPLFDDNPVIKQKYDIVVDFIKTKYGIDLPAIGNATL